MSAGALREPSAPLTRPAPGSSPKQRAQQQQRRARRPGLRARRRRERDRDGRHATREAGEDLRQTVLEVRCRGEDRGGDRARRVVVAVAREAGGDQRVLVRPDRAGVVAERVVAGLARRRACGRPSRSRAARRAAARRWRPPRPRRGSPTTAGGRCSRSGCRPGACRRRARARGSRARASRSRGGSASRRSPARCSRRSRERGVAPDLAREPRAAPLRVVDVALDLAGRDRPARERAVGELDRVPAVLPALVDQAGGRVAALVFDVAVAVEVAAVARSRPAPRGRWARARGRARRRRSSGGTRRAARGTAAWRRRFRSTANGAARRARSARRSAARAGSCRAPARGSRRARSPGARRARAAWWRPAREVGQRLEARDQAVATEQRHEPGQPGRGQRRALGEVGVHAQRGEVAEARPVGAHQRGVVRLQHRRAGQPRLELGGLGRAAAPRDSPARLARQERRPRLCGVRRDREASSTTARRGRAPARKRSRAR